MTCDDIDRYLTVPHSYRVSDPVTWRRGKHHVHLTTHSNGRTRLRSNKPLSELRRFVVPCHSVLVDEHDNITIPHLFPPQSFLTGINLERGRREVFVTPSSKSGEAVAVIDSNHTPVLFIYTAGIGRPGLELDSLPIPQNGIVVRVSLFASQLELVSRPQFRHYLRVQR